MSHVKPSPAQLACQKRMRDAGKFYRQVLADPVLLKKYRRLAKEQRISLPSAAMAEILRGK